MLRRRVATRYQSARRQSGRLERRRVTFGGQLDADRRLSNAWVEFIEEITRDNLVLRRPYRVPLIFDRVVTKKLTASSGRA